VNSLDLYAKIEPLIGFYEEYEELYENYLALLHPLKPQKILDIGCGNGKFLKHLQDNKYEAYGIERSEQMIQRALLLGVKASRQELDDFDENSFDCIVAIGDVLNYIPPKELDTFFLHVSKVLKPKGYFLADVNTLEGFEVAQGAMACSKEDGFLSISADFIQDELRSTIVYFQKEGELYKKYEGEVIQYFHPQKYFKKQKYLDFKKSIYHSMFSDENEKEIMVFQK
jgi:SAM-dependent methyltransferase